MKKYIISIICLMNLLVIPFIANADTSIVVRVGAYENFPKIFTGEDDTVTGLWADIIRYICEKENWQIEWVTGTWAQGLKRLKNGEINIMPDTGWSEPRSRQYVFSREIVLVSWSRLYVPQGSEIKSIIDLEGKTIAGLERSINLGGIEGIKEIIQKFNLEATFQKMDSYEQVFKALEQGRIDAGVTNKDFGNQHEDDYAVERTSIIFQPVRLLFSFTKGADLTPFFIEKIDGHMKKLKADKDSIYYQALEKYIGGKYEQTFIKIIPAWVKIMLVVCAGMILFLIAVGITSRVKVRRRTFELRKSEERFRMVFDEAPDTMFIINMDDRILDANMAASRMLGYTCEEFKTMAVPDIQPPEVRGEIGSVVRNELILGKVFEGLDMHKDGTIVPIEIHNHKMHIKGQEIVLSMVRDITDRKHSESELKKIEMQLLQSQKMESIGTLAGGIAHDFNNILSGILGYSQLAETNINNPVKEKRYITQIIKGTQRAAELVQQILTFSRKSEYQKQPFYMYIGLNEALKLLRSTIPTTIEIKTKIDSKAMALADPTKIHQLIMNLCTNAYHAMRETGGLMTVSLTDIKISKPKNLKNKKIPPGNYLKLEVSDTGHGMDEKILKKAFDPYFTTKQVGKGTGLGLALVQAIVDEHDGFLEVYSDPNKGTNFYIYLPIIIKSTESQTSTLEKISSLNGNEKIMFIDDEEPIRQIAKEFLEKYGYKVSLFENGVEAYREFEKTPHQFDLTITDMTMPGMTGYKLAADLLKIRPDFPILLCTGFSEDISEEKAASIGIMGFLFKPVSMKDLVKKIRTVLDKNKAEGTD